MEILRSRTNVHRQVDFMSHNGSKPNSSYVQRAICPREQNAHLRASILTFQAAIGGRVDLDTCRHLGRSKLVTQFGSNQR